MGSKPCFSVGLPANALQDLVELAPQFRRQTRALAPGGNRNVYLAALYPRRHHKIALRGGIGDIGKKAAPLGRDPDPVIGSPIVGGGENQHRARQVGSAKMARHAPHRQPLEFLVPLRRHHRHPRPRLQQPARLPQRHFSRSDHQHRAIFEIQKYGVKFQPKL